MNVQLPDPGSYGGVVLSGWTVNTAGGAEKMSGCVIVKASYDLLDSGGAARSMVRSADKMRFEIVFSDSGAAIFDTKGTADPADDKVVGYDLEREADIALQKARADIVVKGWGGLDVEGEVRVDGTQWLLRTAAAVGAPDVKRNLFGWHSRTEDFRKTDTPEGYLPNHNPDPLFRDELPSAYGPEFNNFFRRSDGFSSISPDQSRILPSAGTVAIRKKIGAGTETLKLGLPNLEMKARLRCWCGDCEDKPGHWSIKQTIPLVPDTLIVEPLANKAEIIWRGLFDWDEPGNAPNTRRPIEWRLAQVMEGAF